MTTAESKVMPPGIRILDKEQPWQWLAAGWADLWRAPAVGLAYGLVVAVAGGLLTLGLLYIDSLPLVLPLAAGFMLLGPMLAVGLYETSRRLEAREPIQLSRVVFVATRSPAQLAFIGLLLMLFMLVWARIATLLFALFFGTMDYPPLEEWVSVLIFSAEGLAFLLVGTATGGLLAVVAFAVSAVSVPLLMVRDVDAVTAVLTSIRAVKANPLPMLLWAWLIALLTAFGIATLYLGLIVTFPLVGHATWHAFRAVIQDE
jgi:uncharacterized membrane protein